jgi:uncharacterized protein YjbI with pentapeptide repeats
MRWLLLLLLVGLACPAQAQDMMRGLDLTSPAMTQAEMSRADVVAALAAARGKPLDLTGKRLSGLDLSGLDLSGAVLRAARLNHSKLIHTKLDGANLDQVCWGPISPARASWAPACSRRNC